MEGAYLEYEPGYARQKAAEALDGMGASLAMLFSFGAIAVDGAEPSTYSLFNPYTPETVAATAEPARIEMAAVQLGGLSIADANHALDVAPHQFAHAA